MKTLIITFTAILFLICCASENKSHTQMLNDYKSYVDSVLNVSKTRKFFSYTIYQETPIDPENPEIIRVDTIVITPKNGDSSVYSYPNSHRENLKKFHEIKSKQVLMQLEGANPKTIEKINSYKIAIDTLFKM